MVNMKAIKDFISFRKLCLINAEAALMAAEVLRNKKANHISYHLCTLALEEIGKVFIAWFNYNRSRNDENEDGPLALDDHTKKIFWAFWWETFGNEIPTQHQIDSNKKLASNIHLRRLQSLYTETNDTVPASDKISDEELDNIVGLVKARLELAKADDFEEREESEEMKKFMVLTNDPEKRQFIFGEDAQNKLIESGDVKTWVNWLIAKFDAEQIELDALLKSELERPIEFFEKDEVPKWRIKIKIGCPLHAIRPNILNEHNKSSPMFQLFKGGDKHTLIIDVILSKNTSAPMLWHYGYIVSRMYVGALNIAAGGFFWWRANVDLDKYYESIKDLESKKNIDATLITKLHWPESNFVLTMEHLQLTKIVNSFMVKCYNKPAFEPFIPYLHVLALMSKNDVHLRFEEDMYMILFNTFKTVITKNETITEDSNYKENGYFQISGMYKNRDYYFQILEIGETMMTSPNNLNEQITLTEVLAMKQYLSIYLLTLAVRDFKADSSLRITNLVGSEKDESND
jgi:AbiV family abortive infection protein